MSSPTVLRQRFSMQTSRILRRACEEVAGESDLPHVVEIVGESHKIEEMELVLRCSS
jgi:hypothetical protein